MIEEITFRKQLINLLVLKWLTEAHQLHESVFSHVQGPLCVHRSDKPPVEFEEFRGGRQKLEHNLQVVLWLLLDLCLGRHIGDKVKILHSDILTNKVASGLIRLAYLVESLQNLFVTQFNHLVFINISGDN